MLCGIPHSTDIAMVNGRQIPRHRMFPGRHAGDRPRPVLIVHLLTGIPWMDFGRSRRAGTVDLSDEFIANREIGKRVFCSAQGVSGRESC